VIERARHVGQQVWIAVADGGHQRPELDARRRLGPGAQHRPALEVLAGLVAAQRPEMVPVEDDVGSCLFHGTAGMADHRIVRVLGIELHADPDRSSHHGIL
jgi:hypothetical protein